MELLTEIRNQIDFLRARPEEFDIDETIRIFSEAYEVARSGLERSQNADLYLQIKPEYDKAIAARDTLKASLHETAEKLSAAERKLLAFAGVLTELREEVKGQVRLTRRYNKKRRESLCEKIELSDVNELIRIRNDVRDDFNSEWNPTDRKGSLTSGEEILEPMNFKTGA